MTTDGEPLQVALVDDYDVVVIGVANMLEPYRDRVVVAELDTNKRRRGRRRHRALRLVRTARVGPREVKTLIDNPHAKRVVIYTWNFHPELVSMARDLGVDGYLSKTLSARELVNALEAVHAGETVISPHTAQARTQNGDWPGRHEGLTDREAEILALITQGKNNAEICKLTYLSPNTVKSYIRGALPEDRGRQPDPSRPLGRAPRVPPRPPAHRALARGSLTRGRQATAACVRRDVGNVQVVRPASYDGVGGGHRTGQHPADRPVARAADRLRLLDPSPGELVGQGTDQRGADAPTLVGVRHHEGDLGGSRHVEAHPHAVAHQLPTAVEDQERAGIGSDREQPVEEPGVGRRASCGLEPLVVGLGGDPAEQVGPRRSRSAAPPGSDDHGRLPTKRTVASMTPGSSRIRE